MTPPGDEAQLRIGLFTDSYSPSRNGVAVAVGQIQAHLLERGYQVTVVAPRGRLAGRFTRQEFLLSSVRVRGLHPPLATGWGYRRCMRRLARADLDLVHVHGFGPVSLLGICLAKRAGIPLFVTWHTDLEAYLKHYRQFTPVLLLWAAVVRVICGRATPSMLTHGTWRERSAATVAAALLRSANLVIVPSDKTAMGVARLAPDVPLVVLRTGIDPIPAGVPDPRVRWTRPVILYVGRIASEKGTGLLLDAFARLRRNLPHATLVLVGDDTCARSLKRRLRTVHNYNVHVTGEIDRNDLGAFYAAADFFVFPSVTDTQGLVMHEAAHAGLPLVMVDDALARDLAIGSDTIVAAPDPVALASAMATMAARCSDPDFVRRVGLDGQRCAARFSVAGQLEKLIALYRWYARPAVAYE